MNLTHSEDESDVDAFLAEIAEVDVGIHIIGFEACLVFILIMVYVLADSPKGTFCIGGFVFHRCW